MILAELLRVQRTCLRQRTIAAGNATNSKVGQTTLSLAKKKPNSKNFSDLWGVRTEKR